MANRVCGKRLVAVLRQYVEDLKRLGELDLDAETLGLLLSLSAAGVLWTIAAQAGDVQPNAV